VRLLWAGGESREGAVPVGVGGGAVGGGGFGGGGDRGTGPRDGQKKAPGVSRGL